MSEHVQRTESASRVLLYRMVTAPTEVFAPQVGWIYEWVACAKRGFVKLRLVELPDGEPFDVKVEITVPIMYLGQHFEEVA